MSHCTPLSVELGSNPGFLAYWKGTPPIEPHPSLVLTFFSSIDDTFYKDPVFVAISCMWETSSHSPCKLSPSLFVLPTSYVISDAASCMALGVSSYFGLTLSFTAL